MVKFHFNKLVRDKIVRQLLKSGAKPMYHELKGQAYVVALIAKLSEEASELQAAEPDEIISELADLQQVLDDIRDYYKTSHAAVVAAQKEKLEKTGGFSKGIYIDHVELDESDPWVSYYRKHADRYIEFE